MTAGANGTYTSRPERTMDTGPVPRDGNTATVNDGDVGGDAVVVAGGKPSARSDLRSRTPQENSTLTGTTAPGRTARPSTRLCSAAKERRRVLRDQRRRPRTLHADLGDVGATICSASSPRTGRAANGHVGGDGRRLQVPGQGRPAVGNPYQAAGITSGQTAHHSLKSDPAVVTKSTQQRRRSASTSPRRAVVRCRVRSCTRLPCPNTTSSRFRRSSRRAPTVGGADLPARPRLSGQQAAAAADGFRPGSQIRRERAGRHLDAATHVDPRQPQGLSRSGRRVGGERPQSSLLSRSALVAQPSARIPLRGAARSRSGVRRPPRREGRHPRCGSRRCRREPGRVHVRVPRRGRARSLAPPGSWSHLVRRLQSPRL